MKLKGTEPVDSIDLSSRRPAIAALSAVIIANLLVSNTATKSLE